MSYKELAIQLINNMPDYKLATQLHICRDWLLMKVPMTCIVQDY